MNKRPLPSVASIANNLGHPKYNKAISKILTIGLLILGCIVIAVGAYYALFALPKEPLNGPKVTPTPTPTSTPTPTPTPTSTETQLPDLEISDIKIYPSEPKAKIKFTAQVWVANVGEALSGSYDLAVWIEDVSSGYTYVLGKDRNDPMYPGDNFIVWSDQVTVEYSGDHQLWAEIIPFGFEDDDEYNNKVQLPFWVAP